MGISAQDIQRIAFKASKAVYVAQQGGPKVRLPTGLQRCADLRADLQKLFCRSRNSWKAWTRRDFGTITRGQPMIRDYS